MAQTINQRHHMGKFAHMVDKLNTMPALLALIVQLVTLSFVLVCSRAIYSSASAQWQIDTDFFIFSLVVLQSIVAGGLACSLSMAVWWRWIHFFFPIALWLMTVSQIPNSVYLTGFVISLALYWTTFKTRVPFYPSSPAVWRSLASLMHTKSTQSLRMIDIGSGIGDMSMTIAKQRPQDTVEGIEIAPLPWLISYIRAQYRRSSARFSMGDYQKLDFADYDVVFAYLSPAAMPQLWQKASQEMQAGSLLVSLEFDIPDVACDEVIEPSPSSPKLYVWHL